MSVTIPELVSQFSTLYDLILDKGKYFDNSIAYKLFNYRLKQISDELAQYDKMFHTYIPIGHSDSDKEEFKIPVKPKFVEEPKIDLHASYNNVFEDFTASNYDPFITNNLKPDDITPFDAPPILKEQPKIEIPKQQQDKKEIEIKLSKNQRKRKNQRLRKQINNILGENLANLPENKLTDKYFDLQMKGFKQDSGETPK